MSNDKLFKKFIQKEHKNILKDDVNIEKVIIESIIENLKNNEIHNLGEFGYIKKTSKMIEGKSVKSIDFFANDDSKAKIIKDFKKIKDKNIKSKKTKKLLLIALIPFLLSIFILITLLFLKFDFKGINNQNNKSDVKLTEDLTTDLSKNDDKKDNTSDFIIYENKKIIKEKIDYKSEEIVSNKDKSIIIKTEAINNTKLKQGEFTTENVSIDGKIYTKNLYIIKKGDTLWDIAKKFLKNPFLWPNIHKDNPYIKNPHKIEPNYKLTIYTVKE